MKTFKEFINEDLNESYTLHHTHTEFHPMDDTGFDDDSKTHSYDVHHKGKKVGELKHATYFGMIHGNVHNKDLPELSGYSGEKPHHKLNSFIKSKTGQRWASNLHKYNK